jgi:hypothetical protein
VLAISDDGWVRRAFEGYFAEELARTGLPAITCYNLLTLAEIKQDKPAAAQRFQAGGSDAILILRLVDQATSYRQVQAGNERYAATITGIGSLGWYDYYDVAFVNMTTSYGTLKQTLFLESTLYNFKSQKPAWSALTRTVVAENTDRLAEAKLVAQKVTAAMRADGMIR